MSDQLIIFILAALGAGLGSLGSNFFIARLATAERKETRRKERMDFLLSTLDQIINAQVASERHGKNILETQRFIALAISISDDKIFSYVDDLNVPSDFTLYSLKIISRLGELIKETSKAD